MPKRSRLSAIVKGKCPRCRQGDMFVYPHLNYLHFREMNESCPHCNLRYELEPGFFYGGAMYFSYAFSVALFVTVFVAMNVLFEKPPLYAYVGVVIGINLLLFPLMFRYARILFLHLIGGVKYQAKYEI